MRRVATAVGLLLTLLGGAPALASPPLSPVVLVHGLYRDDEPPDRVESYFAADLAQAYRKDTSTPGDVGTIDFDWRYGAQDFRIADLKVASAAPPAATGAAPAGDTAYVTAQFRNFGAPKTVLYRLCRRGDGAWRIADVSADGSDRWDLREMLKLPLQSVRC